MLPVVIRSFLPVGQKRRSQEVFEETRCESDQVYLITPMQWTCPMDLEARASLFKVPEVLNDTHSHGSSPFSLNLIRLSGELAPLANLESLGKLRKIAS